MKKKDIIKQHHKFNQNIIDSIWNDKKHCDCYLLAKILLIEIDTYCSDLYLPVNDFTKKIINNYVFKQNVKVFQSEIAPHELYFDIPFSYSDYYTSWKAII